MTAIINKAFFFWFAMSYYVSPRFLDKLAIHITKNFMDLPGVRVPVILGVHGRKGEGKSFQCELVFKLMGIEPVRMSAGELESPDAGDPVRLIRSRYREAADLIKVRGKMCVLLINDLDAGAGRIDKTTQYTVNTQLVNGTLMNIADNPTDVQLPGSYETQPTPRVPIIVTGNDFSTLYAPLVRDGRMDKFYWEPSHEDRLGIVAGIFEEDRLSPAEVDRLVAAFPNQSIDFFGALRSRVYDEQVRTFIRQVGINRVSSHLVNNPDKTLSTAKAQVTLQHLIALGAEIVEEQHRLVKTQLAQEYVSKPSFSTESLPKQPIDNGHQTTVMRPLEHHAAVDLETAATPPQGWPSHVSFGDVEQLLERSLRQGGRLSLETASPREKSGNIWRSWPWSKSPDNATRAAAGILDCIKDNPQSYIKLIGYNPKTQTRILEEMIVRPQ
jgi:ribulose bisphosphate carboxylase small subunit